MVGKHAYRIAALGAAVVLCGCNLWPDLGEVDLPYGGDRPREVRPASFEAESTAPPRSVEDGLTDVREREPAEEQGPPRVVAELKQGLRSLSVADVRAMVLRNNLDLDVALYKPAIAAAKVSEEIGKFDAIIGANFEYANKDLPKLDGPLVDFTSDDPLLDDARVKLTQVEQQKEFVDMGLGVTVPLPTGAKVKVDGILAQQDLYEPQNFEQYVAATRFSLSQPLLRNAGTDVNLAAIRLARTDARAAEVQTKLKALKILMSSEKAYWRLYATRRFLDVRAEQFRLADENLKMVEALVGQGLAPEIEVLRAATGRAVRVQALIEAETAWRLRQRDLKAFLAADDLPLGGEPWIEITTEPLLAGVELDADALVARAMAERLELIEIELKLVEQGIRVGVAENQVWPIANLDVKYGTLERQQGFGSAWSSQWDLDHDELMIGVNFEIPFTNQRARARLDATILDRARMMATREARELQVRREVYNAVDVLQQNWQRIVAARQRVIVAGANYDAELEQFRLGIRTMREVIEALTELGDAQLSEIRAIVDYQVSQIDLAFATGTLLGYARVDLAPIRLPEAPIVED